MQLSTAQKDRAIGAVIASAAGDALGANCEFKPPLAETEPVEMHAATWKLGEWTDDTSMAIAILRILARGDLLENNKSQDEIVAEWCEWAKTAPDVGIHTGKLLRRLSGGGGSEALAVSRLIHSETGQTAGNGSLMRTGPVALGSLDSAEQTAANAARLSQLTHWDSTAAEACVLWSLAIRHAILTGEIDVRVGLDYIDSASRETWQSLIAAAEAHEPSHFSKNGWVIHAFQAAWSAIYRALRLTSSEIQFESDRLRLGIENSVRAGWDTDTVAAIAGSLLGAGFGYTSVPAKWLLPLHGLPLGEAKQLLVMAQLAASQGRPDSNGWPTASTFDYSTWGARHEFVKFGADDGLYLGGVGSLSRLPEEITAVVSLCRLGQSDVPAHVERHLSVMLIDDSDPEANQNLEFTFANAAAAIKQLRDQGHKVFLHCVQSQSRTPSVAVTYAVKHLGLSLDDAYAEVMSALPEAMPNPRFERILAETLG